jgi:hemolysin activation/secretion protein
MKNIFYLGTWPKVRLAPLALIGLSGVYSAHAQTPPDAGTLRQQIERDRVIPLPRQLAPEKAPLPPAMESVPGISLNVKSFRFVGNTLLSTSQLELVIVSWLNRPLGFGDLQEAAAAVANSYREAGWVVRAYLPKQEIADDVVTIQIVEAVFAGAFLEGSSPTRVRLDDVIQRIEALQPKGQLLNANALDRAVLLSDDLPGVSVSGALRPGQNPDSTEIALTVIDKPLISGESTLDNTGSRATGLLRGTQSLSLNSPSGRGDLFNALVSATDGSRYGRLAYSLPVGAQGLRVGTSVSRMLYRVITPEFSSLNSHGNFTTAGFDLTYPLVRARMRNLYLNYGYDRKRYYNEASLAVQSDYRVDVSSLGLSGNTYDNFGGGGANTASLTWFSGMLNQGVLDSGENSKLAGSFSKWRYSASRQQVLTDSLSLYASYSGQHATRNLDSSEKFYLGGASGVRAFPSSEGSGSAGQLATVEMRVRLPNNLAFTVFHDRGRVVNFDSTPSYSLAGSGVSFAWKSDFGMNVKFTVARRDKANPNPITSTGRDQDGSLVTNRYWLVVNQVF